MEVATGHSVCDFYAVNLHIGFRISLNITGLGLRPEKNPKPQPNQTVSSTDVTGDIPQQKTKHTHKSPAHNKKCRASVF